MKKTLLITWWLGYIGSHAVVAFEQAGYSTVIVDNLSNSDIKTLEGIQNILWYAPDLYQVDLRDTSALEKLFTHYDFDWVLHFAWLKSVSESCSEPLTYFDNNIVWSIVLFKMMEKYSVRRIIFSSSATVYNADWFKGDDFDGIWETSSTWKTTNPYGTTKYLLERILQDLSRFAWFQVMSLRYFNPIGAHESGYIGENPSWIPNNLLPYILKVAWWELEKLTIFWWDYETHDGTWVRDYIDVCDLVTGHLQAYKVLEKQEHLWYHELCNLGRWVGISVLELLSIAKQVTHKEIPHIVGQRRQWDLASVYCDTKKAEKLLWWSADTDPSVSIARSWKFYSW